MVLSTGGQVAAAIDRQDQASRSGLRARGARLSAEAARRCRDLLLFRTPRALTGARCAGVADRPLAIAREVVPSPSTFCCTAWVRLWHKREVLMRAANVG